MELSIQIPGRKQHLAVNPAKDGETSVKELKQQVFETLMDEVRQTGDASSLPVTTIAEMDICFMGRSLPDEGVLDELKIHSQSFLRMDKIDANEKLEASREAKKRDRRKEREHKREKRRLDEVETRDRRRKRRRNSRSPYRSPSPSVSDDSDRSDLSEDEDLSPVGGVEIIDKEKEKDDAEGEVEYVAGGEEEAKLMRSMGFTGFGTSKGKDHSSTDVSGVKKQSKRQYRQYMNRRGGFNRTLDTTY